MCGQKGRLYSFYRLTGSLLSREGWIKDDRGMMTHIRVHRLHRINKMSHSLASTGTDKRTAAKNTQKCTMAQFPAALRILPVTGYHW